MSRVFGLLAGRGDLPEKIITHCHQHNFPLYIIAFDGQTEANLISEQNDHIHGHLWTHFGAVGEILDYLKSQKVTHIIMAGTMNRPSWSQIKLDWKGAQWFAKLGIGAAGDDGLLKGIEKLLKGEGFEIVSPTEILDDLLVPEGVLGQHHPNEMDWQDIDRGKTVAKMLGVVDVGQAVVVQEGLVLGVEAIEGTESLLSRCVALRRGGRGGVLVKMAKPNQSRALDLPTIGVATIQQAKAAGLRGIAVEAGATQILDKDAVVKESDDAQIFLIGISSL